MKQIPSLEELNVPESPRTELNNLFSSVNKNHFPGGLTLVVSPDAEFRKGLEYALLKKFRDAYGDLRDVDGGWGRIVDSNPEHDVAMYEDFGPFPIEVAPETSPEHLNFMKSAARMDPSYVLVDEIKDIDEYIFALQLAVTGHRVVTGINASSFQEWIGSRVTTKEIGQLIIAKPDMLIEAPTVDTLRYTPDFTAYANEVYEKQKTENAIPYETILDALKKVHEQGVEKPLQAMYQDTQESEHLTNLYNQWLMYAVTPFDVSKDIATQLQDRIQADMLYYNAGFTDPEVLEEDVLGNLFETLSDIESLGKPELTKQVQIKIAEVEEKLQQVKPTYTPTHFER